MTRPFLISFIFIAQVGWSQATITPEQDSIIADIKRRTRLDYQNMLQQLEIVEVRPGANGNDPKAPNAANYNEAKANPYPEYPDPLVFNDGSKVSSAKDWHEKRRQEILEDFDSEVYGRLPDNIPAVTWKVIEEHQGKMGDIATTTKKLIGHAGNSQYPEINVGMEMSVTVPANTSQAVPLILQFSFSFPPWFPKIDRPGADQWKEDLLNEGWGYAEMKTITIQDDNGAGLTQGIIGLVNKGEPRTSDQWGALRAWAWGAGRALDYFETDAQIDEKKAGITGHSRLARLPWSLWRTTRVLP
jgi:hypothetical protein